MDPEVLVNRALSTSCVGVSSYFRIDVPSSDAAAAAAEATTAAARRAGSAAAAVAENALIAAGWSPYAAATVAEAAKAAAATAEEHPPAVELNFVHCSSCGGCCSNNGNSSNDSNSNSCGSNSGNGSYPVFIGIDICSIVGAEMKKQLRAPSSFCFFIDEAILRQPQHCRRVKDLARQLSGCNDSSSNSFNNGYSSDSSNGSSNGSTENIQCSSCWGQGCEKHCPDCCWCCFGPSDVSAGPGEAEQQPHLQQQQAQQQQTPCVFFSVKCGETAKTAESAAHINKVLLLLAQKQQEPEQREFNGSINNTSSDSCCSLRLVFCGDDAEGDSPPLKKRKTKGQKTHEVQRESHGEVKETFRVDRQTVLVAVGGGALTDLVGFAAAQLLRGVHCLLVPTTLLAAVDAAVGGKTAVNLGGLKNMLGLFTSPVGCVIDLAFVASLPERQIRSGLAEVVKIAAALSPSLLNHMLTVDPKALGLQHKEQKQHEKMPQKQQEQQKQQQQLLPLLRITVASVALKALVVSQDFKDLGLRNILNLGHTIGHAIETTPGVDWTHGECVAAGSVLEAAVSRQMGVGSSLVFFLLLHAFRRLGLPFALPPLLQQSPTLQQELLQRMQGDKKNRKGMIRMVMLEGPGRCVPSFSMPVPLLLLRRLFSPRMKLMGRCLSSHAAAATAEVEEGRKICRVQPVCGNVTVPGSKSIANRVLLLAALRVALGGDTAVLQQLPCCSDCSAMALALQQLAFANISLIPGDTQQTFTAIIQRKQKRPDEPFAASLKDGGCLSIWCGDSGTTSRFLLPLCAFLLLESAFAWAWCCLKNAGSLSSAAANTETAAAAGAVESYCMKADAEKPAASVAVLGAKPLFEERQEAATLAAPPSITFQIELDGDTQLRSRPIGDLVKATKQLIRGWSASFLGTPAEVAGSPGLPAKAGLRAGAYSGTLPVLLTFTEPLQLLQQMREDLAGIRKSSQSNGNKISSSSLSSLSETEEQQLKGAMWQRALHRYMPGGVMSVSNAISSQFASAILMAAPLAASPVFLTLTTRNCCSSGVKEIEKEEEVVSLPYLRMTQRLMEQWGFQCLYNLSPAFRVSSLWQKESQKETETEEEKKGGEQRRTFAVEGDASSASYFFGIAAVTGGKVTVNISRTSSLQGDSDFPFLLSALGFGSIVTENTFKDLPEGHSEGVTFCGASSDCLTLKSNALVNMRGMSDCLPTLAAVAAAASTAQWCCSRNDEATADARFTICCSVAEQKRLQASVLKDLEALKQHAPQQQPSSNNCKSERHAFSCFWTTAQEREWRYLCIFGVGCVRYKESNRLEAVISELQKAGYTAWCGADYLAIALPPPVSLLEMQNGSKQQQQQNPCSSNHNNIVSLKAFGDHRLAMSWSVLGIRRPDVYVQDWQCVSKTFMDFWKEAEKSLNLQIHTS